MGFKESKLRTRHALGSSDRKHTLGTGPTNCCPLPSAWATNVTVAVASAAQAFLTRLIERRVTCHRRHPGHPWPKRPVKSCKVGGLCGDGRGLRTRSHVSHGSLSSLLCSFYHPWTRSTVRKRHRNEKRAGCGESKRSEFGSWVSCGSGAVHGNGLTRVPVVPVSRLLESLTWTAWNQQETILRMPLLSPPEELDMEGCYPYKGNHKNGLGSLSERGSTVIESLHEARSLFIDPPTRSGARPFGIEPLSPRAADLGDAVPDGMRF